MNTQELYGVESKKVARTKAVSREGFVTVKEAAALINRSEYRIRQLVWEDKLSKTIEVMVGNRKRVLIEKNELLQLKTERKEHTGKTNKVNLQRLGRRVQKSAELMITRVKADKQLAAVEKKRIVQVLGEYLVEGETIEKNNK